MKKKNVYVYTLMRNGELIRREDTNIENSKLIDWLVIVAEKNSIMLESLKRKRGIQLESYNKLSEEYVWRKLVQRIFSKIYGPPKLCGGISDEPSKAIKINERKHRTNEMI